MLPWILKEKKSYFYSCLSSLFFFLRESRSWKTKKKALKFEELFYAPCFQRDHPVLPHHSTITLQRQIVLQYTRTVRIILVSVHTDLTQGKVGTYKELRKKQIQLQKDASNLPLPSSLLDLFFLKHCSCRKAHAFRSGTSADIMFCISSSACNLAHKVSKSHFAKSSNNKTVCSSQQASKRNHLGHTELIFTLSLTCSHL